VALSDTIAALIERMITEGGGSIELKRNDLAGQLGCVPSQINYVITSRFTPERGYIIESRRGGGGYVRIIRKQLSKDEYLMHFFHAIGEELDRQSAIGFTRNLFDHELCTAREAKIISAALSCCTDNKKRADTLRQIILAVME